jgi:hypothetical protein
MCSLAWPAPAPLFLKERANPGGGGPTHVGADVLKARRQSSYVACITVMRQSRLDVGFREVFVAVDGEQMAVLRYGESITCEVPAGPHRVRAHNTLFWKTHDLVLQPGDHARFTAINRAGWGTFGLLLLLGASPIYLTFERDATGASAP